MSLLFRFDAHTNNMSRRHYADFAIAAAAIFRHYAVFA